MQLATLGRTAAFTATLGMIFTPAVAFAEQPAIARFQPSETITQPIPTAAATVTAAFNVSDVSLESDGTLRGQAVTAQGQPLANQAIALDNGVTQTTVSTDSQGQFQFDGVRGGAYRVQVADQTQFIRAWTDGTAPPSASRGLMVVEGGPTILGQYCASPVGCGSPVGAGFAGVREAFRNPLVVGGIVAAAIAIPVALHNSDDDDPEPAS
jgi:hypothetical protein